MREFDGDALKLKLWLQYSFKVFLIAQLRHSHCLAKLAFVLDIYL